MSTRVQGWLFTVPSTQSIGFFPAKRSGIQAEALPWDALLMDDMSLAKFARDIKATAVETGAACLCFYIDCPTAKLDTWFSKHSEMRANPRLGASG